MNTVQRLAYESTLAAYEATERERLIRIEYQNLLPDKGEIAIDVMVPCINSNFPTRVYFDQHDYQITETYDLEIGHILFAMCCGCYYDDSTLSDYGKQKILRAVIEHREEQEDILMQQTAEVTLSA